MLWMNSVGAIVLRLRRRPKPPRRARRQWARQIDHLDAVGNRAARRVRRAAPSGAPMHPPRRSCRGGSASSARPCKSITRPSSASPSARGWPSHSTRLLRRKPRVNSMAIAPDGGAVQVSLHDRGNPAIGRERAASDAARAPATPAETPHRRCLSPGAPALEHAAHGGCSWRQLAGVPRSPCHLDSGAGPRVAQYPRLTGLRAPRARRRNSDGSALFRSNTNVHVP